MTNSESLPLAVVDIGNTLVKLGIFDATPSGQLPEASRTLSLRPDWIVEQLTDFLDREPGAHRWYICSVNRPAADRLTDWLGRHGATDVYVLRYTDLPLTVDVERPEAVGLDRLANAVAVNRLRGQGQPAIVVDSGTAIKVDLISASGAFSGGAIMPGLAMSARALHEFTDLLPLIEVSEPPAPLGKSTLEAIRSGLYWGAVGAVGELIERLSEGPEPAQIFLTGGAASGFADFLAQRAARVPLFVPHLTLSGIALATPRGRSPRVSR